MSTVERSSWWDRNGKWLLPVTCVLGTALFATLFAGIFLLISGMMKSSGAYRLGMAIATREPAIISALGQPITPGFLVTGSINTTGDSGAAQIEIPLQGPHGSASLHLQARRRDASWTLLLLTADIPATHRHIDLLAPAGASGNREE